MREYLVELVRRQRRADLAYTAYALCGVAGAIAGGLAGHYVIGLCFGLLSMVAAACIGMAGPPRPRGDSPPG